MTYNVSSGTLNLTDALTVDAHPLVCHRSTVTVVQQLSDKTDIFVFTLEAVDKLHEG